MTPEIWIAVAAANFAACLAPGQNVAFAGSATARGGVAGGMAAAAGILGSELIWSVLALILALGARELAPTAWLGLQVASGLFLVLLGGLSVLRRPSGTGGTGGASSGRVAAQGLWVGLANPFNLVFFLSLFPLLVAAETTELSLGLAAFFASAVIASAGAALLPYLLLSGFLARRGLGRILDLTSGAALLVVGLLVLGRLALQTFG